MAVNGSGLGLEHNKVDWPILRGPRPTLGGAESHEGSLLSPTQLPEACRWSFPALEQDWRGLVPEHSRLASSAPSYTGSLLAIRLLPRWRHQPHWTPLKPSRSGSASPRPEMHPQPNWHMAQSSHCRTWGAAPSLMGLHIKCEAPLQILECPHIHFCRDRCSPFPPPKVLAGREAKET